MDGERAERVWGGNQFGNFILVSRWHCDENFSVPRGMGLVWFELTIVKKGRKSDFLINLLRSKQNK